MRLNFQDRYLKDYYYDTVSGDVFSTKRAGDPYRMKWQRGYAGKQFVALSNNYGGKENVFRDHILNLVESEEVARARRGDIHPPKSKFAPVKAIGQTIVPETFIIGTIGENGELSTAAHPKVHTSEDAARREAERLAKTLAPKEVVLLKIVGRVKSVGVSWA